MDGLLTSSTIHYLTKENIQAYSTLKFFSNSGEAVSLNPWMLAAFASNLMEALGDRYDEDSHFITEFTLSELQELEKFSWSGKCDESVCQSIFQALGVGFQDHPPRLQEFPKHLNSLKLEIKEEPEDFKDESESDDQSESEDYKYSQYDRYDSEDEEWTLDRKSIKSERSERRGGSRHKLLTVQQEELFKTYELPQPLDAFRKPPSDIKELNKKIVIDPSKKFSCDLCGFNLTSSLNLNIHKTRAHFDHYKCMYCKKVFMIDEEDMLRLHMFKHEQNILRSNPVCVQCGKRFNTDVRYRGHLKTWGPYHDDECAQCPKKFSSHEEYKEHVNDEHYGIWKVKCGHCKDTFDDNKDLKFHVKFAHSFKNTAKLKVRKPSVPKKQICHECGKYVNCLVSHIRLSHTDLKIPCPHCDHTAKSDIALKSHINWFHDKIPCEICGEMVGKGKRMKEHITRKHTSIYDRRFKCEVCGKGFTDRVKLSEHKNVHTGEKPFKCKFCNAAYSNRANRYAHEKSHLGIKRKK